MKMRRMKSLKMNKIINYKKRKKMKNNNNNSSSISSNSMMNSNIIIIMKTNTKNITQKTLMILMRLSSEILNNMLMKVCINNIKNKYLKKLEDQQLLLLDQCYSNKTIIMISINNCTQMNYSIKTDNDSIAMRQNHMYLLIFQH